MGAITAASISAMSIGELRTMGQELGIENADIMIKSELIKAITKAREK